MTKTEYLTELSRIKQDITGKNYEYKDWFKAQFDGNYWGSVSEDVVGRITVDDISN